MSFDLVRLIQVVIFVLLVETVVSDSQDLFDELCAWCNDW